MSPLQTKPSYISVSGPNGVVSGGVALQRNHQYFDICPVFPFVSLDNLLTVTLNGVTDRYGNTLPTISWSFEVPPTYFASLWGGATIPDVALASIRA